MQALEVRCFHGVAMRNAFDFIDIACRICDVIIESRGPCRMFLLQCDSCHSVVIGATPSTCSLRRTFECRVSTFRVHLLHCYAECSIAAMHVVMARLDMAVEVCRRRRTSSIPRVQRWIRSRRWKQLVLGLNCGYAWHGIVTRVQWQCLFVGCACFPCIWR